MLGTAQNKALWEEAAQEPNAYTPLSYHILFPWVSR